MAGVFMLLLKPVIVNDPLDNLQISPDSMFEPAYLEYLDFKNGMDVQGTPWRDMLAVIVVIFIVVVLFIQFFSMMLVDREVQALLNSSNQYHAKVEDVSKFYLDTKEKITTMEKNANDVKLRYQKAEELISHRQSFTQYRSEFELMRESWTKQLEAFQALGVDLGRKTPMDDDVVKAQLTMAKGFVDRELGQVDRNIMEDELSLREAERDARALQRYLGK